MDKLNWRVTVDSKVCRSGYILFYVHTNLRENCQLWWKNRGFGDRGTLKTWVLASVSDTATTLVPSISQRSVSTHLEFWMWWAVWLWFFLQIYSVCNQVWWWKFMKLISIWWSWGQQQLQVAPFWPTLDGSCVFAASPCLCAGATYDNKLICIRWILWPLLVTLQCVPAYSLYVAFLQTVSASFNWLHGSLIQCNTQ